MQKYIRLHLKIHSETIDKENSSTGMEKLLELPT